MLELIKLFNAVKKTSKYIRQKNPKADGYKFWQPIKKILNNSTGEANKWKIQKKQLINHVMNNIPEFIIYGNKEKKIIEHNHFIIQTVRIPLQDKPTIKKIIQIALNIGQCKGMGYKYNKLLKNKTKITDYISTDDIIKLSKLISKNDMNKILQYLQKWNN